MIRARPKLLVDRVAAYGVITAAAALAILWCYGLALILLRWLWPQAGDAWLNALQPLVAMAGRAIPAVDETTALLTRFRYADRIQVTSHVLVLGWAVTLIAAGGAALALAMPRQATRRTAGTPFGSRRANTIWLMVALIFVGFETARLWLGWNLFDPPNAAAARSNKWEYLSDVSLIGLLMVFTVLIVMAASLPAALVGALRRNTA